jgi:hypothetical protein
VTSGSGLGALRPLMAATVFVLLASVAGFAMAVAQSSSELAIFAAAAFVGALVRLGYQINSPWWRPHAASDIGPSGTASQPVLAARNAVLLALGYGWGSLCLLTAYLTTTLKWQHGWQYGTGMALIAMLIYALSRRITAHWRPAWARVLIVVSAAHATAALAGVSWLAGSGKLWSAKADWAANIVFAGGGVIIAALSVMAIATAVMLGRDAGRRGPSPLA